MKRGDIRSRGFVATAAVGGLITAAAIAACGPTEALHSPQQRLLTEQSARGNIQTPLPAPPCIRIALPFPSGGIIPNRQGGPFGSAAHFQAVSSWAGSAMPGGAVFAVWSGDKPEPGGYVGAAAVTVYTETLSGDGCGVDYAFVGTFTDADVSGPLMIVAASGRWLSLSSPTGQLRYFDLIGDRFSLTPSGA